VIQIPLSYNYIAVFLTLACNLKCSYCINRFGKYIPEKNKLTGKQWIKALNKIQTTDLPITLQGGEPTLHPDFYSIVNGIYGAINIDLLTNGKFDIKKFMENVPQNRMKRDSPYASIRVSYHPEQNDITLFFLEVKTLLDRGYSVGIWGVNHPLYKRSLDIVRGICRELNIDFRTKEFLGEYKNKLYGTYKYEGACEKKFKRNVFCRTSELIIGPDGSVYRCHADLYESRFPVSNITNDNFRIEDVFRYCSEFGHCNPCDVKIKTNRFQEYGHTSVIIEEEK